MISYSEYHQANMLVTLNRGLTRQISIWNNSKIRIILNMKQKFKNIGLKLTPQRMAIFKCLEGNITHPSAEDIYEIVKKEYPAMSLATVYNTLQALSAKGVLSELSLDSSRVRYDPNAEAHNHIVCTSCGRIVDVFETFDIMLPYKHRSGFMLTGSHIEFRGLCPLCKRKGGDRYGGI